MSNETTRALFDRKAHAWNDKYAEGGPLRWRIDAFFAALERCAVAPGASVLDFGCGSGPLARSLASRGYSVSAADISPEMLAEGRRAAESHDNPVFVPLEPDWRRLPFDDGRFDAVVSSSVLEYVPEPRHVLAELGRVLRPGGVLLATVPNPRHRTRRLEHVARIATRPIPTRMLARMPGKNWLTFLRVSRNHLSVPEWQALSGSLTVEPMDVGVPSAMMMLAFRKDAAG